MSITPLPTPPSRATPSDFSTKADAFIAALPVFVTEANAQAAALELNSTTSTSVTSLAIGAGSKSLTVDTGKSYQPGMSVKIAYTTDPTNWMHGDVISYNTGTGALVVNVTTISGSGTQAEWTITFSAPAQTGKTELATGFSLSGGTVNKMLTVSVDGVVGDWSWWGIKNLRLIQAKAGDATRVQVNPDAYNIPILIGTHWHVMTAAVDVDEVDNLDTGTLAAGTDYYVYACTDGTTLSFLVSANATNPTGFDTDHSRKIGGFHTLCVAVGAIGGHTLTNYAVKDILPASVWCLKHRAKTLVNAGLVYDDKSKVWVQIYLASGTGSSMTSVNGGTISDTRNKMDFIDDGLAKGMRLLRSHEFVSAATGCNEETNITASADPGTTGGHTDTAGRRMISNIGCEDCCGVMWQWLLEDGYYYYGSTGYWGNLPGAKGSVYTQFTADPGAPEVDNADAGADIGLLAGGDWGDAARCGSRFRRADYSRWNTYSNIGARFVSEPL